MGEPATQAWPAAHARPWRAPSPAKPAAAGGKGRRPRRRRKKKQTEKPTEEQAAPKRYETTFEFDYYDLIKDCATAIYYIGWYDEKARQMRRRSLEISDRNEALDEVSRIDKSGMTGDPIAVLRARLDMASLLKAYEAAHAAAPSAGFNRIVIHNHLIPLVGHIAVDAWKTRTDFPAFQTEFLARGYALGYFSRVCAVLRAALNEAEADEKIDRAPRIPEPMSDEDRDEAPLKGRVMTPEEIARLIDQVSEPHLLEYLIGEINSAGRQITILQSDTTRIDWPARLFNMNPRGRRQNKKYRPTIKIAATWEPWLRAAPPGPLIRYRGEPVKSVKKAMRLMRKAAGLMPDTDGVNVTSYSIRHSLGRFLEACDVPPIERSILLGHIKTYNKKSTERYSPTNRRNPNFLAAATRAIEKFVHEINRYTRKWDLLRPHTLKPRYERVNGRKTRRAPATRRRAATRKDD